MNKKSLTALAREQLEIAAGSSSGRSSVTLYGGQEHTLRQTVVALVAGQRMDAHVNPGESTVHVLRGRIRLVADHATWDGVGGDLIIVPDGRHAVEAVEDSALLLTVAKLAR